MHKIKSMSYDNHMLIIKCENDDEEEYCANFQLFSVMPCDGRVNFDQFHELLNRDRGFDNE